MMYFTGQRWGSSQSREGDAPPRLGQKPPFLEHTPPPFIEVMQAQVLWSSKGPVMDEMRGGMLSVMCWPRQGHL